ncbi:hypothetical protein [Spirosoma sordidisoli]|uniref:Uncharacterized protein n=1 Tax=Spirosoma sordidisoli TaxID=2502893 RepID=A0A4Q2UKN8_9BACT|nr:hypothetical protein [Spirosoma sordidisoli]RYC70087.1 hypothetical protein EQG79_09455 [Spirosoma sordidisoli]
MRFNEEIRLHGVSVIVTGEWEPAELPTWDYPGSKATVSVTTATVGGVDVQDWIDLADWHEEVENLILSAVSEPCYA